MLHKVLGFPAWNVSALNKPNRKHTAAPDQGFRKWGVCKRLNLKFSLSVVFQSFLLSSWTHFPECSINRSLPFRGDKPCWKVNLQTSFLLSFLIFQLELRELCSWEFIGFFLGFLIFNLFTFPAVGLSWYIAMIPVAVACLIVGGICMHKCWKNRADKGYTIPKV